MAEYPFPPRQRISTARRRGGQYVRRGARAKQRRKCVRAPAVGIDPCASVLLIVAFKGSNVEARRLVFRKVRS